MGRFTRLTMLFAGFLALQLNALGGGVACLLAASAGQQGIVSTRMAEMGMAPTPSERGQSGAGSVAVGSIATQAPSQSPCQQSGTQHSACQSMTPCAAAFATPSTNRVEPSVSIPSGRIALVEVAPSSHSLSPDLPPPKA